MKRNSVFKFEMGNVTITVVMEGFWLDLQKGNSALHNHASYEFHMIMKGDVNMETETGSVELAENDSVLIPPELFHGFTRPERESAVLSFVVFIRKNNKKNCADYAGLIKEKIETGDKAIMIRQNLKIKDYIKRILSDINEETLVAEDVIRAEFILLFAEIFSTLAAPQMPAVEYGKEAGEIDTRILIIEEYFNQYYMEKISLKSLSSILYLSEKQTDRMIKKAFGEGFRQHLCKIRMLVAQSLLTDSDKAVQEIAEEVGYQSYNGFYLTFKQKNGMTPMEYRENFRKVE